MAVPVIFNTENNVYTLTSTYYKSPNLAGNCIFQSVQDFAQDIPDGGFYAEGGSFTNRMFSITDASNQNVITFKYERRGSLTDPTVYKITQIGTQSPIEEEVSVIDTGLPILNGTTYTVNLSSQTYIVKYGFLRTYSGSIGYAYVLYTGFLNVAENRYPLKKYTITDVIVRACDLIEPLKYTEYPRFRFDGVEYSAYGNVTGYTAGSQAAEFDKIIASDEPVGRKLDFLLQEMNRETNTVGSKANNAEMAHIVVNMKNELEKIREQIQNLE